jgi:DUF1365 family protein
VAFRREDHLGGVGQSLAEATRAKVEQVTGARPSGRVFLLTQLRHFGHYFSPLNLYYCFGDDQLAATVAEVSNTPWGERHQYVLWEANRCRQRGGLRYSHAKQFHVSPFMDMDASYDWRLNVPGPVVRVHLSSRKGDRRFFDASMVLRRRPLENRQLVATMLRFPFMTVKIVSAIYFQALRLWMKKCPFYPHPNSN